MRAIEAPVSEDASVARSLVPVSIGLTVIYAFFVGVDALLRPPALGRLLLPADALCFAIFGALAVFLARREVPHGWAQPMLGAIVVVLLASITHLFARDPQPLHTIYLMLVVIGAGSLFLSWSWFAASSLLVAAAWSTGALLSGAGPGWSDHGFGLVAAIGLGGVLQGSRLRAWSRTNALVAHDRAARIELERTLEAVRLNQDRFDLLARATNDVAWDWDLTSGKLWWSEHFYKVLGHPDADHVRTIGYWSHAIHPEDRRRVAAGLDAALAGTATNWADAYRLRKGDGTYRHVLDRGFIMRDGAGKAARMIGSLSDVTAQHEAQATIRREKDAYRMILDALGEAGNALVLLEQDRVTYANESARRLLGVTQEGRPGPLLSAALGTLARDGGRAIEFRAGDEHAVTATAYALDRADATRVLVLARAALDAPCAEGPEAENASQRPR